MAIGYARIKSDLDVIAELHAERQGLTIRAVWLLEPGLHAVAGYRLAHSLWERGWRLLARWVQNRVRRATGVDIHPGARIGRRLLIISGGGVVIGESATIGDDCLLEPGVKIVSGGLAFEAAFAALQPDLPPGLSSQRIHASVGHRVVLEAGCVLVGDVYVGNDVRVLANTAVTRDVPDHAVAVGVPLRTLPSAQVRPDPDARAVQGLAERFYKLEEQVHVIAFQSRRQSGGLDPWQGRPAGTYGPIPEVDALIDGAGI